MRPQLPVSGESVPGFILPSPHTPGERRHSPSVHAPSVRVTLKWGAPTGRVSRAALGPLVSASPSEKWVQARCGHVAPWFQDQLLLRDAEACHPGRPPFPAHLQQREEPRPQASSDTPPRPAASTSQSHGCLSCHHLLLAFGTSEVQMTQCPSSPRCPSALWTVRQSTLVSTAGSSLLQCLLSIRQAVHFTPLLLMSTLPDQQVPKATASLLGLNQGLATISCNGQIPDVLTLAAHVVAMTYPSLLFCFHF